MEETAASWGTLPAIYHPAALSDGALRAAYHVATAAHPMAQRRRKPDGAPVVPYLCHPVLCFKILRAHGVRDKATLMAGLLHDALESSSAPQGAFVGDPASLRQALQAALVREGEIHASGLAEEVTALVSELTPNKQDGHEKTERLRLEAMRYSPKARLVKMADHAATLMDDLFIPPKDTDEQQQRFIDRARETARICAQMPSGNSTVFRQAVVLRQLVEKLGDERTQQLRLPTDEVDVYSEQIRMKRADDLEVKLRSVDSIPLTILPNLHSLKPCISR
jgi:hypothetical protein